MKDRMENKTKERERERAQVENQSEKWKKTDEKMEIVEEENDGFYLVEGEWGLH